MTVDPRKFETGTAERPLTALTADVAVYVTEPLTLHKEAALRVLDAFHDIVPKKSLSWYCTESMERDKPCTARTFSTPAAWWRPGAATKTFRFLQMRDGETYNAVPRSGLRLICREVEEGGDRPFKPSLVRFMFPAEWASSRPHDLLAMARLLADGLPVTSGHGGYCIERNRYYETAAIQSAYPLAMRHHGVDIDDDVRQIEFDHIKTVNWLTVLGTPFVERLGGRRAVEKALEGVDVLLHDATHGLIIQAGPAPEAGDVNRGDTLPHYRAVYRAVESLFAPAYVRFNLKRDDDVALTDAWYRRFG